MSQSDFLQNSNGFILKIDEVLEFANFFLNNFTIKSLPRGNNAKIECTDYIFE